MKLHLTQGREGVMLHLLAVGNLKTWSFVSVIGANSNNNVRGHKHTNIINTVSHTV